MFKSLSSLSLSLVLVAGCSSATPASLVDARAAYQRAAQGPAAQLTPAQLHAAETSLAVAEQTYEDEGDSENARDRAYVAQRKAELAEAQASIAASEKTVASAVARVDAAKTQNQVATQSALNTSKAVIANQSVELQGEKDRRLAAEQALANLGAVKQESRGTVITLSGAVIFATGQANLLPGAQAKLDQVATALSQGDAKGKILIEGHTDSRGSADLNQGLSQRRADAVKAYLTSKNIEAERMTSQGVGPSRPIADNATAEGRANNRRVEIVVQPD